jgi:Ni/Fe-hydrogenase 1 B-type cytochrome subunit
MHDPVVKRVLVWSGWLRVSHASIGLSVLAQLLTGWLIAESPSVAGTALDIHYLASAVLIFGLVIRLALMFAGKPHERLPALFPASFELAAMASTLRCYLSFFRASLPGWYAHNPLWKPFYLLMYLVLVIMVITGVMIPETSIALGFYLPSVHTFWAHVLLWLSALHVVSVIVHDYRKQTTDISAMVNGYRLFLSDSNRVDAGIDESVQLISPDSLKRRL